MPRPAMRTPNEIVPARRAERSAPTARAPRASFALAGFLALATTACMERPHYAGALELPGGAAGGRTLTVTSAGSVLLPVTRVEFDCVLTTDADTPGRSWTDAAHRLKRLIQALQDEGVPPTDLTPRGAALSTRLQGWRVTQHLRVGTDDLPGVSRLLEAAMGPGGANDVTDVRSGHKHPRGAVDRARERALEDARETAEMLAAEVSLRLGEVLSVEALPSGPLARAPLPDGADVRAPGAPGDELEVEAVLRVTWRLEP